LKEPRPDDLGFSLPEPARLTPTRAIAGCAIFLVLIGGAFAVGYLPRLEAKKELEAEARSAGASAPRVDVVTAKIATSDQALSLPGSIQALEETTIYPRVTGYVRKWDHDIGDRVKEGEVLAEIDTPELDQQIVQAKAQLAQAEASLVQSRANADFAGQNLARYERLAPAGVTSQEELDRQRAESRVSAANIKVAEANIEAQRANIGRLAQEKSFARVLAPFAGTVTARSVERGALVSAGNATPLFRVAALDPVRVFVQVPQDAALSVKPDAAAKVTVREFPGRVFDGKVARAAGALDPATRTMTTEVRVPNPKGELLPGVYAQVALSLPMPHKTYEIPATALMNDAAGPRVATVAGDDTIHIAPVAIERDTGATFFIASGLDGTERIVKLAGPELTEGRQVAVNILPAVAAQPGR
jgi:RND family efflux transporter MFP subunit